MMYFKSHCEIENPPSSSREVHIYDSDGHKEWSILWLQVRPIDKSLLCNILLSSIMQTCPCSKYPLTSHFYVAKVGLG